MVQHTLPAQDRQGTAAGPRRPPNSIAHAQHAAQHDGCGANSHTHNMRTQHARTCSLSLPHSMPCEQPHVSIMMYAQHVRTCAHSSCVQSMRPASPDVTEALRQPHDVTGRPAPAAEIGHKN